jgi:flagellar biosynthesis component FlhA
MAETKAIAAAGGWKLSDALSSAELADLAVPQAVLAIIVALVVPLPSFLLDVLISIDITM